MTKINTKYTQALTLLLVVTLAPASIAFAQSSVEAETTTETTTDADAETKIKTRADVKARMVDAQEKRMDFIKDEIRTKVRDVASNTLDDRGADLTFRGHTDGWAIVGGKAFESSIEFGGDAHHVGGGNWKISSTGELMVGDRHAKLDLSGFARGNVIHLQGNGSLESGESFRIMLRGHFAPTDDRNVYAVAFTNAHIQYMDSGIRVPLMQVGSVTIIDTILPATAEPVHVQQ
jgi:hypothetical protein